MISPRARRGIAANPGCAAEAAASAAMPFSGSATSHSAFPVDGSSTASVAPDAAGRQAPPTNRSDGAASTTRASAPGLLEEVMVGDRVTVAHGPAAVT